MSRTHESPSDRVASFPQFSLEASALLGHPIVEDHKQINVTFTDRSRGQTTANILSGPKWNVFDTSPRFITAFAAVHACECVCVCPATARTPVLVGGSEGLLYRLNPRSL